jgi:group I intron endonuclease
MTIGIYALTTPNGNTYIGQSVDCERRIKSHISLAERGKHPNNRVQRAYTKHGNYIVSRILCSVPKEHLSEVEQLCIDLVKPTLNISQEVICFYDKFIATSVAINRAAAMQTPAYKAKVSINTTKMWADPIYRAKQSASRKESWSTPELKEARLQALKKHHQTESFSAHIKEITKKSAEARQREVLDSNNIKYPSIKKSAEVHGVDVRRVHAAIKYGRNIKGIYFKYAEER